MKIQITFHNMPHSKPMEDHANQKLDKIKEFLKDPEFRTPMDIQLWLKANPTHPHHEVELSLKTPQLSLEAHDKGTDMYVAVDNTIDKMVKLIVKEKKKIIDKRQKIETDKKAFADDKYNL